MNAPCPSADQLEACVRGDADASTLDQFETHLAECAACLERFQSLSERALSEARQDRAAESTDASLLQRAKESPPALGEPMVSNERRAARWPVMADYEIEALLGEGGQAAVYRARQSKVGQRVVAIKRLATGAHPVLRSQWTRFQNEALAYARLEHPNIVRMYDFGEDDGGPFLVLEYVSGGTLRDWIDRERFTIARTCEFVETLARAVHFAHEQGLVHRDLKPRNILLTPEGTPKISDFGLVAFADEDSDLSQSRLPLGTKEYMSPEQAVGSRGEIGQASDVYSLGVILYELLTGRPPFVGDDLPAILLQIRDADPLSPRALRPGLSRDLETICLKCLRKSPDARYASAESLADDLLAVRQNRPISARAPGFVERSVKWVRRHRAAALIFAALTIGLASASAFGSWAWLAERRAVAAAKAEQDARVEIEQSEQRQREQAALALLENGRYHAARGDWPGAKAALREAVERHPAALERGRLELAKIHIHLSEHDAAREQLDSLREVAGVSSELTLCDAMLAEGTDPDRCAELARQVVGNPALSAADQAYANALCAANVDDCLAALRVALAEEPWHLSAGRMLIGTLLLTGRLDESAEWAARLNRYLPDDRSSVVVDALRLAAQGKAEAARAALEPAREQWSESVMEGMTNAVDIVASVTRQVESTDQPNMPQFVWQLLKTYGSYLQLKQLTQDQQLPVTLPPGLRQAYQGIVTRQIQNLVPFFLRDKPALLAEVGEQLTAVHRDSFTLYLRAHAELLRGHFAEADELLWEGAHAQSFVDVRSLHRYYALRCEFQLYQSSQDEDKKKVWRERIAENLAALLDVGESRPERLFLFGMIAWRTSHTDLLLRTAEQWRKVQPESAASDLLTAYCFHTRKEYFALYESVVAAEAKRQSPPEWQAERIDFQAELRALKALALAEIVKNPELVEFVRKSPTAPEKPTAMPPSP